MKKLSRNLTVQVLTAIALGILVGALFPAVGASLQPVGDVFVRLIKMLIAPIIFLTVVLGMGSMGSLRQVGRVGGKALLYFELVTTLALLIGVMAANLLQPGTGINTRGVASQAAAAQQYARQAAGMDWGAFFLHIIPESFVGAFAQGDVLQVLVVAVLVGLALSRTPPAGRAALLPALEQLSHLFFGVLGLVMKLAPLGAFGDLAFTIGTYGLAALLPLAKLMGTVYITMAVFVFGVLSGIAYLYRFSLWRLLTAPIFPYAYSLP
ncbi:cation:dicarboxylate symporter family transporter [Hymenobacter weizhouensis]|uniref:cation:dicarboxylate symporter family transporter n=1 Tax=Hymenobacter sp. YIM 151500-1 TaxID=2987689 RepID=UPI002227247D|nr:cation:dicarboxylase symporter family transporter [Hymenobacter sp. YIM 151500-1]UYZ64774.1 cation:dicarboxylase symporter family transporter [Hymenobacter sp. YIM 151500-1]